MILIHGGRVVSPKNGVDGLYDILIDGDKIVRVSSEPMTDLPGDVQVLDAAGKHVFPWFCRYARPSARPRPDPQGGYPDRL